MKPKRPKRIDPMPAMTGRMRFTQEENASYNRWIASRRYRMRLPYVLMRGGARAKVGLHTVTLFFK